MLRKTKLANFICAILIGVIVMMAVVALLFVTGVISLDKSALVISTGSAEAVYDGTPITNHTWDIEQGELKKGHELTFKMDSKQVNVGECNNTIEVVITDELGAIVTGDYNIDYQFGKLQINPRTILVTYKVAENGYTLEDYEISDKYDGIVFGHRVVIKADADAGLSDDGSVIWKVTVLDEFGSDVTSNYRVIMNSSNLTENESSNTEEESSETETESGSENTEENTEELFKVTADCDGSVYLKYQNYGNYNGNAWDEAVEFSGTFSEISPFYLTAANLTLNSAKTHSLKIDSLCGLRLLPYYTTVNGDDSLQNSDVFISSIATEPYTVQYVCYDPDMTLQGTALYELESEYRSFVYQNYLSVDYETQNYLSAIIAEQGFSTSDPDIINKIAKYISESATYDPRYDKTLDSSYNTVMDFLGYYKEGISSHFASAATLLYRSLGIPARYTEGVAAGVLQNHTITIKNSNVHAWVEVYVDGLGWVLVETTGVVGGRPAEVGIVNGEAEFGAGDGDGNGNNPNAGDRPLSDEPPVDEILYYITPDSKVESVYLKEGSSGNYDGKTWLAAEQFPAFIRDTHSAYYLPSYVLENAGATAQSILIEPAYSSFALPYYASTSSSINTFGVQTSDTYFAGNGKSYTVAYYPAAYTDFQALWHYDTDISEYEQAYRQYVKEAYTHVDDGELKELLQQIIIDNNIYSNDIYTMISHVSLYVRNCATYNLEYDRAIDQSEDIVLAFLNQKEGVCRHFASTATLMFRLLGVPARYTYGAVGSAEAGVRTAIDGKQAHAWVEVYIDGIGWVQVEVTPGTSEVTRKGEMNVNFSKENIKEIYDRKEHEYTHVKLEKFEELEDAGYTYKVVCELSDKNNEIVGEKTAAPGKYTAKVKDILFYSPTGEDVSDYIKQNYDINTSGNTTMTIQRPLNVYDGQFSFEKTYDGKPFDFYADGVVLDTVVDYYYEENLNSEHTVNITYQCDESNANKEYKITYLLNAYDADGNDVSDEYIIKQCSGIVTINPPELRVTSGSLTVTQDEFNEAKLLSGDADFTLKCQDLTVEYKNENGEWEQYATAMSKISENEIECIFGEKYKLIVTFDEISAVDENFNRATNMFTQTVYYLTESGTWESAAYNFNITPYYGELKIK